MFKHIKILHKVIHMLYSQEKCIYLKLNGRRTHKSQVTNERIAFNSSLMPCFFANLFMCLFFNMVLSPRISLPAGYFWAWYFSCLLLINVDLSWHTYVYIYKFNCMLGHTIAIKHIQYWLPCCSKASTSLHLPSLHNICWSLVGIVYG